jgi:hypothetical protein
MQPVPGTSDWFTVTFPAQVDHDQHNLGNEHIFFSRNDGTVFRFDIAGTCGGASLSCTAEGGGPSTGLQDWSYSDTCGAAPNCRSRTSTFPTTLFIRVARTTGGTDCSSYQLTVTR